MLDPNNLLGIPSKPPSAIYLQYTGNAGTSLTIDVTNIDFITRVTDSSGAWNGTAFVAPRNGWYNFSGGIAFTAGSTARIYAWVDGVRKFLLNSNASTSAATFAGGTYLSAGQTVNFRSDTTVTLSNSATLHWIAITSQNS